MMIGLFETGYIAETGFFERDVREPAIRAPGMGARVADAIRRGKVVCERYGTDLFDVDYDALAAHPIDEVREVLHIPSKSEEAEELGWPGTFDPDGMSEVQRRFAASRAGGAP